MKRLHKILLALFAWVTATTAISFAQVPAGIADTIVTFRFHPGADLFTLKGNEAELARLYALVDEYHAQIAAGGMPVRVDGYCASLSTEKENLMTAFIRANRVKSELITHKGLKEADFRTANYAQAYHNHKDIVVVTLRIPAKAQPGAETPRTAVAERQRTETPAVKEPQTQPAVKEPDGQAAVQQQPQQPSSAPLPVVSRPEPYRFALRTNLLYDALLLPTLGAEWRVNRDWGIRLDGSLARWGDGHGKVQKVWLLNPEVRRYLLRDRRFYVGAAGSYGEYNIYRYPLGSLFPEDTGYQGKLWSAGVTAGYQLCLSRRFSVDFNLGLGYTRSVYDSFTVTDGVRVVKGRNRAKNLFGPTQAGINLIWTIGGTK